MWSVILPYMLLWPSVVLPLAISLFNGDFLRLGRRMIPDEALGLHYILRLSQVIVLG
jgi:hypothetical protein